MKMKATNKEKRKALTTRLSQDGHQNVLKLRRAFAPFRKKKRSTQTGTGSILELPEDNQEGIVRAFFNKKWHSAK